MPPRSSIGSPACEMSQSRSAVTRPFSNRKFAGPASPWTRTVFCTRFGAWWRSQAKQNSASGSRAHLPVVDLAPGLELEERVVLGALRDRVIGQRQLRRVERMQVAELLDVVAR